MKYGNRRKTAPKVKNGVVQKKNNHEITAREKYVVDRERPDKGYKHVISKRDIHDFIELIPDWSEVSTGIESIILDSGSDSFDGMYQHYYYENTGAIRLSAWPKELWVDFEKDYYEEHRWHLNLLGVVCEERENDWYCHFTENQARAFMLMHIFLHELGHHVDKLRSKNQQVMAGGEEFAENYANKLFEVIWPSYVNRFGEP